MPAVVVRGGVRRSSRSRWLYRQLTSVRGTMCVRIWVRRGGAPTWHTERELLGSLGRKLLGSLRVYV